LKLVVDANIIFAALIKNSTTRSIILKNELSLYVPEFFFEELKYRQDLLLMKSGLSQESLNELINKLILTADIKTIQSREFKQYLNRAIKISPDKKDIQYFALAIKLKCSIWSNDKDLKKQNKIKIYSTEELIKNLSK